MLIKLQSKTLNKNNSKRSKKSYKHELSSFIGFCFKIPLLRQVELGSSREHKDLARAARSIPRKSLICLRGILKQNHQFSNSFISIPTLWVVTALFGCLFLLSSNNVSATSDRGSGYDVTYVDLLNNLPNPTTGDDNPTSVTLSNTRPISTRPGYIFKGWCSVATTDNTCSGTTYQPGASYPLSEGRVTNLYAIWGEINCSTDTKYIQEVTSWQTCLKSVGDATTAIDNRDGIVYHVGRQADGKIWMTQNLDLILSATTLTNKNTDLNSKTEWTPPETARTANVTVDHTNETATGWTGDYNVPYSAEGGDTYYYTSGSRSIDTKYDSLSACIGASHTEAECKHYHAGNYYNWTAAVAETDSTKIRTGLTVAPDSICPRGWRLPVGKTKDPQDGTGEFANLLYNSGIITSIVADNNGFHTFASSGPNNIRTAPLYFARSGYILGTTLKSPGSDGEYWSSSAHSNYYAYYLDFSFGIVDPDHTGYARNIGSNVRCVAR